MNASKTIVKDKRKLSALFLYKVKNFMKAIFKKINPYEGGERT